MADDRRQDMLRVPPMSVEAEQAVLGAIMLDATAFPMARALLDERDFYRRDHQLIFRAIIECNDRDQPFDSVTLGEWFESQGLAEHVAGGAYLIELASQTPSAANAEAYARIVKDKAVLRRLIEAGTKIVNSGFQPDGRDSDEVLAEAVIEVESCVAARETQGVSGKQGMNTLFADIQSRYEQEKPTEGVPVPYPELAGYIDLFEPECFYGVAGRTKMGKSITLNDVVVAAVKAKKRVGLWSIEMGDVESHRRMLASVSNVEYQKLKKPRLLDEEEWAMMHEGIRILKDAPITSFFDPVVTIEKIAAQAAMLRARDKLDIVVLDYVQIVTSSGKERRDLDVGHVSIGCKNMAKRLHVPVVAGLQVGRASEKMGAKPRPPRASDLRESGNLEQDLDVLIGLHRPGYYDKQSTGCRCEVILNRNGETGVFRLEEDFPRSRFLPSARPWFDHETDDGKGDFG